MSRVVSIDLRDRLRSSTLYTHGKVLDLGSSLLVRKGKERRYQKSVRFRQERSLLGLLTSVGIPVVPVEDLLNRRPEKEIPSF